MEPITRQEIFLASAAGESTQDLKPITRLEHFLKNVADHVKSIGNGGGTGGGASIDVTAQVGQTIVVKEVDANGKPTAWESADYQEKICGDGEKILLPRIMLASGDVSFVTSMAVPLIVGESYVIEYNDVEYICDAVAFESEGINSIAVGDIGVLTGGESTGVPFALLSLDEASAAEMGVPTMLYALDGAESVLLSVKKGQIDRIDHKFLPSGYPYETEEYVLFEEQTVELVDGIANIEFANVPIPGETYELYYMVEGYVIPLRGKAFIAEDIDIGAYGVCVGFANEDGGYNATIGYVYPEYVDILGASSFITISDLSATVTLSAKKPSEVKPMNPKFFELPDYPVFDLTQLSINNTEFDVDSVISGNTIQLTVKSQVSYEIYRAALKSPIVFVSTGANGITKNCVAHVNDFGTSSVRMLWLSNDSLTENDCLIRPVICFKIDTGGIITISREVVITQPN